MIRRLVLLLFFAFLPTSAHAGVATAHLLSFQGQARDASQQPINAGDVRVRVYDAGTGGALVYDSNAEFAGAIQGGVFSVLLGSGAPLLLDNTRQYYLELDINGAETIGDAASGRQAFWPGGGDHSRSDLESRIASLEAMVNPTCSPNTFNLDGNPANGCEFTLDPSGIYVDADDPAALDDASAGLGPSGTGGGRHPCRTIGHGLTRASALGRANVYVANGNYAEAVTLVNGKNLRGGYRSGTWERQLTATATVIRGESTSGTHKRAIFGTNITSPTLVEGFVVFGPSNSTAGGNSYAIYLSNAGGVTLQSNVIYAGSAGPGNDGPSGSAGADGVSGTQGANALQQATTSCSGATNRSGGAGGALSCGVTNIGGGAGGGNRCTPVANTEFSGLDGTTAPGAGGAGGDAGDDGQLQPGTCFVPTSGTEIGAAGGNGAAGANGAGGAGANSGTGSVSGGNWVAQSGNSGIDGSFGRGGGGGGAGGGADGISGERDLFGGAGGGGGSGACGGTAGTAGVGGGGSFGIFVTGGSAPVIQGNVIFRGAGGGGGRGGTGARGGIGGRGASGGTSILFCAAPGGRGGDGGNGGASGGGGGGAGGIACGIFTSGVGTPAYGTNTISGGAPGVGGTGGASPGNSGTAGAAGALLSISNN